MDNGRSLFYLLAKEAERGKRGVPVSELVVQIQECQSDLEYEKDPALKFFYEALIRANQNEIKRRRYINEHYISSPDREIIQTIKEKTNLADVIEKYTSVYYTSKDRWVFRCPLHSDKHPSGMIYNDQQKWHCFQCQKHGDVIDAVCEFGHVETGEAIRQLATNIGVEVKPILPAGRYKKYD